MDDTWQSPPDDLALAPGDLHVWRMPLDLDDAALAACTAVLSDDERARAARFRYDRHRRPFVAARGRLRRILARYLDRLPETIGFTYGAHGKPHLDADSRGGREVAFNLSHSGSLALCAVGRRRRVGVDVEMLRPVAEADRIVERYFSPRELAAYRALPASARAEAFVTCWTRKEAFIKAVGDGLTFSLAAFDVTVSPDVPARLLALRGGDARAWHLADVPVGAGAAATVASDTETFHLRLWNAPPPR